MRQKILSFCAGLFFITAAGAENPLNVLGTYDNWTAYTYTDASGKVCYMAAEPEESKGKYKKRDDVFLMVTHRPSEKVYDVVNTVAGYSYKRNSVPTLEIDKKPAISLTAHENTAWGRDVATDKRLVGLMKAGSRAVLKGTSSRGTKTTDVFSLKGFSKAYDEISQACPQ